MQPFWHKVIDNWTTPELVRAAEAQWPDPQWVHWHKYDNGKLATKDPLRFPPACAELFRQLLTIPIANLTGQRNTFADFDCHGAGLHAMPAGSALGVHLDSDVHPLRPWKRAVNAVLFVNSYWPESWGGYFEMYGPGGVVCEKRIAPRFNRLVLFAPSDQSFHAVSRIASDAAMRKTLAAFYWRPTVEQPKRERAHFLDDSGPHVPRPVEANQSAVAVAHAH